MRRTPSIGLALSMAMALQLPFATRADGAKTPRRIAWAGIARGPLSPQQLDALEALIVDDLDGYDSFRLVDAGGNALDDRLLAQEAARVAHLLDEGIDHLLNFKHKQAIQRIDQAIDVFETRLTPLRDQELLHDALLAKAEALQQSGRSASALEALRQLAALSPKRVPSKKTHPARFVALWENAKATLGLPGQLRITTEEPSCTLLLDGQPLGSTPITATSVTPGRHYLVARWSFFVILKSVQVAPGRELSVEITREGPADQARRALLETIVQRQGIDGSIAHAKRIADLSDAEEVIVAAVRSEGGEMSLLVARHDARGNPEAIARMPLSEDIGGERTSTSVRKLGTALFVDKKDGEFDLGVDGSAVSTSGLSVLLYGRGTGELRNDASPGDLSPAEHAAPDGRESAVTRERAGHDAPRSEGRGEVPQPVTSSGRPQVAPEPQPARLEILPPPATRIEGRPLTKEWWFWAAVGVTFVGAMVVGGAIVLQPEAESTTIEIVLP